MTRSSSSSGPSLPWGGPPRDLPDDLAHRRYYEPTEEGWEAIVRKRMDELQARRKRGQPKRR